MTSDFDFLTSMSHFGFIFSERYLKVNLNVFFIINMSFHANHAVCSILASKLYKIWWKTM